MRGVIIHEFGPIDSHKVEEFPSPTPGPDEVLIDVHAVGLNFPDTMMLQGLYQRKPERPFVPGRDVCGVISAVGEKVTQFKAGDRVVALIWWGGYAEQAVAPAARCFVMPEELDFVSGAAMITSYPTAYTALMVRAQYQPGETVQVNGAAGGVGLAAVQISKAKGALVIAGDISEEKRNLAKENGADFVIDLAADDLRENLRKEVFEATNDRGVDIVLDPVGGDAFDASLRVLRFAGRIVTIGYTSGRIPVAKANYFNVKNLTMLGLALDYHFTYVPETMTAVFADLFDMFVKKQIATKITGTYPLENFIEPLTILSEGKAMGKMVLTTGR